MNQTSHHWMQRALLLAERAKNSGEVPVGAIIVDANGDEISSAHNEVEKLLLPTAHAEMIAIERACRALNISRLTNCDLYVTLEPCAMCAHAISMSRIRRVYFAAYDPKGGGVEHGARVFDHSTCHHRPEIYGGIEEQSASALLQEFFRGLR